MKAAAKFLLVASAVFAAGCTLLPENPFPPIQPQWSEHSSHQSRHYANFPGKTRETLKETKTAPGPTASTTLREFEAGGRYYGTAWTLIPGTTATQAAQDRILEIAAAAAVTSTGGKLVSKHPVTNEGIRGLTYVIDVPQGNTRLRQQIFIVSGVLVEQTYTGPAGTEDEREPGRFFESLKLYP